MNSLVGRKVRCVMMTVGVELLGSATSLNHKNSELVYVEGGVLATSKTTKREVLIPLAICKGIEFLVEEADKFPGRKNKKAAQAELDAKTV